MYIADLHVHSRYSMATAKTCDLEHLEYWGKKKGIRVLGTGDFTHPAWRAEMRAKLVMDKDGLYRLKAEYSIRENGESKAYQTGDSRFVVTGEISCVYKKHGKTRRVHNLLLLPDLDAADRISQRLKTIGNISADGRPVLKLDSRDLLELMLDNCPGGMLIPAHIWTPHYSVFGAFSAFDRLEDCFEDLTPYIYALETGLSANPSMFWQISALDKYQLISNSDAHSPAKLGREAAVLEGEPSWTGIRKAFQTGAGLHGTIEFFPEEGKYHFDGHRNCKVCLRPEETAALDGRCPECGGKLTVGVSSRIARLSDRDYGFCPEGAKSYESLMPLAEVVGACMGRKDSSVVVQREYERLLAVLGPELSILRELPLEELQHTGGSLFAEGIRRLRCGEVKRIPGYDGEYGKILLFAASVGSEL